MIDSDIHSGPTAGVPYGLIFFHLVLKTVQVEPLSALRLRTLQRIVKCQHAGGLELSLLTLRRRAQGGKEVDVPGKTEYCEVVNRF